MKIEKLELPHYYTWYCKCRKSKGTPIAVFNTKTETIRWVRQLPKFITRHNVKISMRFNNANKIQLALKSGATTVLGITIIKPEVKRY